MGPKFYLMTIQFTVMHGPVMVYRFMNFYYECDIFHLDKFVEEYTEVIQEEDSALELIDLVVINRIEVKQGEYLTNCKDESETENEAN